MINGQWNVAIPSRNYMSTAKETLFIWTVYIVKIFVITNHHRTLLLVMTCSVKPQSHLISHLLFLSIAFAFSLVKTKIGFSERKKNVWARKTQWKLWSRNSFSFRFASSKINLEAFCCMRSLLFPHSCAYMCVMTGSPMRGESFHVCVEIFSIYRNL